MSTNDGVLSKILLPTDGSRNSLRAARYAAEIAKKCGSKVTLLHVIESTPIASSPIEIGIDARLVVENETKIKERGKKVIEKTKKPFDRYSVPVETKYFYGHTVRAIVETAEKENFDVIIIGSRGLGGVKRLVLGSVANAVTHQASCPVFIIR